MKSQKITKIEDYALTLLKLVVTTFHLNNLLANHPLNVTFCKESVKNNPNPKYLGVSLDRSLTYRTHLTSLAENLKTRNNIVRRLAGTSWGAQADTLRTAALSLVYSVAEYCAPVWYRSVGKVDVQLNDNMRIVTSTLRSTPLNTLAVHSQ